MIRKALLVGTLAMLGSLGLAVPAQASTSDTVLYTSGTVTSKNNCTVRYNASWVRAYNRAEIYATILSPDPFAKCLASLTMWFKVVNSPDVQANQTHDMSACGLWDPTCPQPRPYHWFDYNVLPSAVVPSADSPYARVS